MSRRVLLQGVGAMVPAVALAAAVEGTAAAAAAPTADGAVRGTFSASGYSWTSQAPGEQGFASGVVFLCTAGGLPAPGRRVRFSISSFDAVAGSVWFDAGTGRKAMDRRGYLDLDTDAAGTVVLDRWLRRGGVPTTAVAARPVLRAQLVGSEKILASARLSVI
ncbi:hypothetical protein [Catellatospora vulcania]|uniref:hypothetical protein n=1 Tax=Catellatospora vulcania TaxID=1460450 RepID=UPI0012D3E7D4|nr:hypothetical protein [Catellatospora vulcania]